LTYNDASTTDHPTPDFQGASSRARVMVVARLDVERLAVRVDRPAQTALDHSNLLLVRPSAGEQPAISKIAQSRWPWWWR